MTGSKAPERKDLSVYWQFTTIETIRAYAREHADQLGVDPETVHALWIKKGGQTICMTTHPPLPPKPKWTPEYWNFIRERARWFHWWLHEYDHALRDSATHPEEPTE